MRAYLISLTAAAILAALVRKLAPKNTAGQAARLGAGLLVLTAMLTPLGKLDLYGAAEDLTGKAWRDPLSAEETDRAANQLLEELITSQAEAYILDKAQALGLEITVEVDLRTEEYYSRPWSVRIRGQGEADQKAALEQYISEQLGIPEERQEWSDM